MAGEPDLVSPWSGCVGKGGIKARDRGREPAFVATLRSFGAYFPAGKAAPTKNLHMTTDITAESA